MIFSFSFVSIHLIPYCGFTVFVFCGFMLEIDDKIYFQRRQHLAQRHATAQNRFPFVKIYLTLLPFRRLSRVTSLPPIQGSPVAVSGAINAAATTTPTAPAAPQVRRFVLPLDFFLFIADSRVSFRSCQ